jgi:hypothetical protein
MVGESLPWSNAADADLLQDLWKTETGQRAPAGRSARVRIAIVVERQQIAGVSEREDSAVLFAVLARRYQFCAFADAT